MRIPPRMKRPLKQIDRQLSSYHSKSSEDVRGKVCAQLEDSSKTEEGVSLDLSNQQGKNSNHEESGIECTFYFVKSLKSATNREQSINVTHCSI